MHEFSNLSADCKIIIPSNFVECPVQSQYMPQDDLDCTILSLLLRRRLLFLLLLLFFFFFFSFFFRGGEAGGGELWGISFIGIILRFRVEIFQVRIGF